MSKVSLRRARPVSVPCTRPQGSEPASYEGIVDQYIQLRRDRANDELDFFRGLPSVASAIEYAALAKLQGGKRHPHQRRLSAGVLAESERRLQAYATELTRCSSFAELHATVDQKIGSIAGVGRLTVYDVALRLGAHLRLEPTEIYMHAGTARGTKSLGLEYRRATLAPRSLPAAFRRLEVREIEDCLCLFKKTLATVRLSDE